MVTHKKYVSLLSLMIFSSSMNLNAQSYDETKLMVTAAAAVVATAGVVWYACQPYSPEALVRQVETIEEKFYALDTKFNFPTISSDFRKEFAIADEVERMGTKEAAHYWDVSIPSLDEDALYKYTGISGIVDGTFHSVCTQLIDEISYLESKFPKTIQREKDPEIKLCLQENLIDLETIHYGCLFLDKLFTYHKPYFELHDLSKKLSLQYAQQLSVLFSYIPGHSPSLYVNVKRTHQLLADIQKLQALIASVTSRYPNLREQATNLSNDLSRLFNNMIRDPRYDLDIYNLQLAEQLRLERLRNQMLRDQLYHSYQEPTTHVYVDIECTTHTAPTKKNKQQETPAPAAPAPTATAQPSSETKSEKPATLETNSPSIFDPEYGMCI